jgi:hypothetical protein
MSLDVDAIFPVEAAIRLRVGAKFDPSTGSPNTACNAAKPAALQFRNVWSCKESLA